MNFYRRYPGDYGRDTAHLTLAQHGAYTLLLDHYYATERPLPADPEALYRICRAFTASEQEAVKVVADQYFPVGPDGERHNARADRQLPDEQRGRDAARENGKKGGRPKKTQRVSEMKPNGNPVGFENETQTKPSGKAPPTPIPNTTYSADPATRRAELWRDWKALPEAGGGSFLGKLVREHGESAVVEAVHTTLTRRGTADPKSFVVGCLRKRDAVEDEAAAEIARAI